MNGILVHLVNKLSSKIYFEEQETCLLYTCYIELHNDSNIKVETNFYSRLRILVPSMENLIFFLRTPCLNKYPLLFISQSTMYGLHGVEQVYDEVKFHRCSCAADALSLSKIRKMKTFRLFKVRSVFIKKCKMAKHSSKQFWKYIFLTLINRANIR